MGIILNRSYEGNEFYLDGECGAFANLFEAILGAQGIRSKRISVSPKRDEFFLVKNWHFSSETYPDAFYPYVNQAYGEEVYVGSTVDGEVIFDKLPDIRRAGFLYEWIGNPDVTDEEGVPGQGVSNPYSDFKSHFLVNVKGKIYDPSYGKDFESVEAWEEESVGAFFYFESIRIGKTKNFSYYLRIRKNIPNEAEFNY